MAITADTSQVGLPTTSPLALDPAARITRAPYPPEPPYLKAVEGAGPPTRQRLPQSEATVAGRDLRFQLLSAESGQGANLMASFNLPITEQQRNDYRALLAGTALAGIGDISEFMVVEVPRNSYGELIDGKSMHLHLPIWNEDDGIFDTADLYGTYFGFSPEGNAQVADHNPISGLLGVTPAPENEYSSHVAYLFSDAVRRPRTGVLYTDVDGANLLISVAANQVQTVPDPLPDPGDSGLGIEAGVPYLTNLVIISRQVTVTVTGGDPDAPVTLPLSAAIDATRSTDEMLVFNLPIQSFTFRGKPSGSFRLRLSMRAASVAEDGSWDKWTPTHRFSATEGGSGKLYATFEDLRYGLRVDPPVAIAYLDKGLIAIIDPALITMIKAIPDHLAEDGAPVLNRYNPADSSTDNTPWAQAWPLNAPLTFGANDAQLKFRSVITETIQTVTCLMLPGEFTTSTNPTYLEALNVYGSALGPVFATEFGLHNQWGELIAKARPIEAVAKNPGDPLMVTIQFKL